MRTLLLVLLCLSAGCQHAHLTRAPYVDPPSTNPTHELTLNPSIIVTAPQDWASVTLHGIHLGDDPASIDKELIQSTDRDWIVLRDGNKVRTDNSGKIGSLGLWNTNQVAAMGIKSQDDMTKKLGNPQHMLVLPDSSVFIFQNQHIHLLYRNLEASVVGVNVVK